MEPGSIALRALFSFLVLQLLLRMAGKRVIGEASPKDFVMAIVVGDLIDDMLWAEVSAAQFAVAAGALVLTAILVELTTFFSPRAEAIIDGVPVPFCVDGKPAKPGMRRERMNEKELAEMLRNKGFPRDRWDEIKHAFVETSGRIAVLLHPWAEPAKKEDRDRLPGSAKR